MLATVFVFSRLIGSMIKPTGKTALKLMGEFLWTQDFFLHVFYI